MHTFFQILEIFIKYTIIVGIIAAIAMLYVILTENNSAKHKKVHYSSQLDLDSWDKRTHHIHPSEK